MDTAAQPGSGRLSSPRPRLGRPTASVLVELRRSLISYLFLLPTFVFLAVFVYQPTVNVVYHSFFRWDGFRLEEFVGLRNYAEMVQDPVMHIAWWNVLVLGVGWMVQRLSPLIAAELVFNLRSARARGWYRTLFVLPMVVPFLVQILIWRFIFDPLPGMGPLNNLLTAVGLARFQHAWLAEPEVVIPALLLIGFPWMSGWAFLVLYAGLQKIPTELLDAAAIDGCGPWRRLRHVDLPLVVGAIRLVWIQTIIGTIQEFGFILVMTGGGPAYASMVPGVVMYFTAFRGKEMGYGAAIGVSMFAVILVLTGLSIRYLRPSLEHQPR